MLSTHKHAYVTVRVTVRDLLANAIIIVSDHNPNNQRLMSELTHTWFAVSSRAASVPVPCLDTARHTRRAGHAADAFDRYIQM